MSMDLHYRPHRPTSWTDLPRALKYALARRLWDHDGTLYGEPVVLTVGDDHYPFLEGLEAAGVEGAKVLRQAVVEFGAVEVRIAE